MKKNSKLDNYFINVSAAVMNNDATNTKLPDDTIVSGYNEQGFPILYSKSSGVSTEFVIIDFSNKKGAEQPI